MSLDISKAVAAKEQLAAAMSRTTGSSSSVKFFALANGKNKLRILPPWTDKGDFAKMAWREVFQHWRVNESLKSPILCSAKTPGLSGECPICDFVNQLRGQEDDPVLMEMANDIRAKRAFLMQVISYASPTYTAGDVAEWEKANPNKPVPFEAGGPKIQVYSATISIMDAILGLIGETQTDITDLETGYDITVNRIYNANNPRLTKYEVTPQLKPTKAPITVEQFDKYKIDLTTVGRVYETDKIRELLDTGVGHGLSLSPGTKPKAMLKHPAAMDGADNVWPEEEKSATPVTNELAELQKQMQAALAKSQKS